MKTLGQIALENTQKLHDEEVAKAKELFENFRIEVTRDLSTFDRSESCWYPTQDERVLFAKYYSIFSKWLLAQDLKVEDHSDSKKIKYIIRSNLS